MKQFPVATGSAPGAMGPGAEQVLIVSEEEIWDPDVPGGRITRATITRAIDIRAAS